MKGKICFYEPNEALAEKLVDYWLEHGLEQYSICYYSDLEKWRADYPSLHADLWVLDDSIKADGFGFLSGSVIWLTSDPQNENAVFKYCSAGTLLHTIQAYLKRTLNSGEILSGTHLISLYSPVKRCMQSTFGITLAHLLSKKGRVLYLNLEGYSGFDYLMTETFSKDISDFIYYMSQSTEDIPFITQKYIYRLGEIDVIPPVLNPRNLQDIPEDMWITMLELLKGSGLYEYIVIDVSDFIHGTYSILRESQYIFSLLKNDAQASAKWQQYCSVLEESGYLDVIKKTQYSEMPHISSLPVCFEDYMQGPLVEYVRQTAGKVGLL